jgi:predicted ribosomally synthesized peptide with nif11-like leader
MSKENVKKFYELTNEVKEMEQELAVARAENNIVGYAKEKGFEFTQEEHDEFIAEVAKSFGELSDSQLDEVAGGRIPGMIYVNIICTKCGWQSGYMPINSYTNYGTVTAVHTATTGHKDYGAKYM